MKGSRKMKHKIWALILMISFLSTTESIEEKLSPEGESLPKVNLSASIEKEIKLDGQNAKHVIEKCSESHKTIQGLFESTSDLNLIRDNLKEYLDLQESYLSALKNIDMNSSTHTGKKRTNLKPKAISPSFFRERLTIADLGIPHDGTYYSKVVGAKHFDNPSRVYTIEIPEMEINMGFNKGIICTNKPILENFVKIARECGADILYVIGLDNREGSVMRYLETDFNNRYVGRDHEITISLNGSQLTKDKVDSVASTLNSKREEFLREQREKRGSSNEQCHIS